MENVKHCLGGRGTMPAIQVVQAPVFYGYAFSAYAEFSSAVPPEQIETALMRWAFAPWDRKMRRRPI